MKKTKYLILTLLFILVLPLINAVTYTLVQEAPTRTTIIAPNDLASIQGQTFKTNTSYNLGLVTLNLSRLGYPGTLNIKVFANNVSEKPTGSPLATSTYNANLLGLTGAKTNITFAVPFLTTANANYSILFNSTNASIGDYVKLDIDTTTNWNGFVRIDSGDSGKTYSLTAGQRFYLKIYSSYDPKNYSISTTPTITAINPGIAYKYSNLTTSVSNYGSNLATLNYIWSNKSDFSNVLKNATNSSGEYFNCNSYASCIAGTTMYVKAIATGKVRNATAQYKLNANINGLGKQANDSVGSYTGTWNGVNLNNGTLTGSPIWNNTNRPFTNSLYSLSFVNGKYATITETGKLNKTSEITYGGWVYIGNSSLAGALIDHSWAGGKGYMLYKNSGVSYKNYQCYTSTATGSKALNSNQWYFILCRQNATKLTMFVNGVEDTTGTVSATLTNNGGNVYIARYNGAGQSINATIDNIYIWGKALTYAEQLAEFQNQNNYPVSGDKLIASYNFEEGTGTTAYDRNNYIQGKLNQAGNFQNSYVNVLDATYLNLSSEFTLSTWIKFLNTGYQGILAKNKYNSPYTGYALYRYSDNKIYCDSVGASFKQVASLSTYTDNNYHFIVCRLNATGNLNLFIDNIYQSQITGVTISPYNIDLYIGKVLDSSGNNKYFNGSIDNVRIYNKSLTQNEINALYLLGVGTESSTPTAKSPYSSTVSKYIHLYEVIKAYSRDNLANPETAITVYFSSLLGNTTSKTNATGNTIYANLKPDNYNITITKVNYYNQENNKTLTANDNTTSKLWQSIINFQGRNKVQNATISNFNISAGTYTNTTTSNNKTLYLRAIPYNINASKAGYYSEELNLTPIALTSTSKLLYFYTKKVNITIKDYFTNAILSNIETNITNPTYSYEENQQTVSNHIYYNLIAGTYAINASALNYASKETNITVDATLGSQEVNISLLPSNKLFIAYIYDTTNGKIINDTNVTVQAYTPYTISQATTDTGFANITVFAGMEYLITARASNYTTANYIVTIPYTGSTTLAIYMTPIDLTRLITIYTKTLSNTFLYNTTLQIQKVVNNSLVTIQKKRTDATGGASFNLTYDSKHWITAIKAGYQTTVREYQATETPLIIYLPQNTGTDNDPVTNITISSNLPDYTYAGFRTYSFTISDPSNDLTSFGLSAYLNGTTYINKSTVASGGTVTLYLNLTNLAPSTFYITKFFKKNKQDNVTYTQGIQIIKAVTIPTNSPNMNDSFTDAQAYLSTGGKILFWILILVGVLVFLSLDIGVPKLALSVVTGIMLYLGVKFGFLPLPVALLGGLLLLTSYLISRKQSEGL
jgi:hypothetical protein